MCRRQYIIFNTTINNFPGLSSSTGRRSTSRCEIKKTDRKTPTNPTKTNVINSFVNPGNDDPYQNVISSARTYGKMPPKLHVSKIAL